MSEEEYQAKLDSYITVFRTYLLNDYDECNSKYEEIKPILYDFIDLFPSFWI